MKTLKEKIAVMQAALDGKEIECTDRGEDEWGTIEEEINVWNWPEVDYRVKPEPLELWIYKYASGKCVLCQTEREAQEYDDAPTDSRVFKVREVTE